MFLSSSVFPFSPETPIPFAPVITPKPSLSSRADDSFLIKKHLPTLPSSPPGHVHLFLRVLFSSLFSRLFNCFFLVMRPAV